MLEMSINAPRNRLEFVYLAGLKFIEHHHEKGGNERIWEILGNPPANTDMIARPESYASFSERKLNYGKILEGLDAYLGEEIRGDQNQDIPKSNLHAAYSGLAYKDRVDIISKIVHVQILTLKSIEGPAGYISFGILKDAKLGARLINLLEASTRNKKERMTTGNGVTIGDFSLDNFSGIEADVSRKLSFTVTASDNGKASEFEIFRICRNGFFLEIEVIDNRLGSEKVVEIAEEIFRRYGQSKGF
jgi:hypothetical protein